MTQKRLLASFGRRRGRRLRAGKKWLMDSVLPQVQIRTEELENWRTVEDIRKLFPQFFNSSVPQLFLEIGFGTGVHLAQQARLHPDVMFIGCEPYIHGVGDLLRAVHEESLHNIRIYADDARFLLEKLPDACLDKVFIYYPDPWPKNRHHKRRLISKPFLELLARVMKPGAELSLASDEPSYVAWMLEHLCASKAFSAVKTSADERKIPPEGWVQTRYEEKALKAGRIPSYLRFIRIS